MKPEQLVSLVIGLACIFGAGAWIAWYWLWRQRLSRLSEQLSEQDEPVDCRG